MSLLKPDCKYSILRRDMNCAVTDKRSKGGIALFIRNNQRVFNVYRSDLYKI